MESQFNINTTFEIKENTKVYNLPKCFKYLEVQGRQTYGQSFKILREDKPIIYKLLIYAIRDKEEALKSGLDLNKGILLTGPGGCGKTSIMHLLKPFANIRYDYKIKTTREVYFELVKRGLQALHPYTHKSNSQVRLDGYCFDDLGAELQIKHFGNNPDIMAEILLSRYHQFVENNSITHITTNLFVSEIESIYGTWIREMFNVVTFDCSGQSQSQSQQDATIDQFSLVGQ